MLNAVSVRKRVIEFLPLMVILVGTAMVSFSLGPYHSYDTEMEFEAASNVVTQGIPYVKAFGTAIDQPPLGFYLEAVFLKTFGLSVNVGVVLVTLFGLGSTVMVYLLGKELYSKTTGLFAAALFGLNPWHIALSRSFFIDVQCLFFSLFCLFVGVLAIRKGSVKLALATGILFAAAILTKFYAAFILIPLFLFYVYSKPKNIKHILAQLTGFCVPALLGAFLWYQVVLGRSMLSFFQHNDLADVVPPSTGVVTSPFFVTNFLRDYGLGLCLIVAIVFSLVLVFSFRKLFSKLLVVDSILLVTIAVVLGVNVYLGAYLNLNVPYFSAVKYDYQALPLLTLLGASLVAKSVMLAKEAGSVNRQKVFRYALVVIAVVLAVSSLISIMYYTSALSPHDYLQYRVEPQVDYGYALLTSNPIWPGNPLLAVQWCGFAFVSCGLLLAGVASFKRLLKRENS